MPNKVIHIASYELKKCYRDGRARSLFIITLLILLVSAALSYRDYHLGQEQYQDNLAQVRLNWDQQSEKDPHDAAHDGTYVIKPTYPLAMIDKGIQQFTGRIIHLGAHERKQSKLNEAKDLTGIFRFGELSPGFLLTYIFPLLLIFLGYNSLTDEKERQTLRLIVSQGISRKKLAFGKWLALMIQMLVLWFLLFVTTIISSHTGGNETMVSWYEWLLMSASYLFYLTIFINLIIWISEKAPSSGMSLSILLTIWIFITLIIPKVSTNVAGRAYPFPTLQTFRENINEDQAQGLNGHNFWNEAAQDFQQKVLKEYDVETLDDLPVAYSGLLLAEGEKYESEIYTKHFDLLQSQYADQRNVYRACGLLSPMLSMKFISMAIARSDYGFLWHFEDEAEKYRVDFNTTLNMNIAENAKGVEHYKANKELWASIPRFKYKWQPVQTIFEDHMTEYMMLIGWLLISFSVAMFHNSKITVN